MRMPFRALLLAGALATAPATSAELPADTAPLVEEAIANGDYVGLVVVLVEGDQVTTRSFGLASKDTKKPVDADTVFQIGSITKTFTGTLLADAVLGGRLKLEDSVQSQLPAGVTIAQVGPRPMTLQDVATHWSGLPRLEPGFAPADPADPYADIDDAKLWRTVSALQPARAPGVAFEYSNLGFGLLGRLVAKADGGRYQALVADKIFKPLGMTSSSADLPDSLRARAAQGYGSDGKPVKFWTFNAVPGMGAINSTAKDMTAYLRANMAAAAKTGGGTPLDRAMAFAQTPRADAGGGKIGLAWISAPGVTAYAHDGGTYGFSSYIGFSGDGKRGVVVLANTFQTELTSGIGTHVLNPALPLPRIVKVVALPADMLQSYVGTYSLGAGFGVAVTRDAATLSVQITGQAASPVFASAPDRFYYKGLPVTVDFDRNAQGQVVRLVFHQAGQRLRVPRIGADGKPLAQPAALALGAAALDAYVGDYQIAPGALLKVTRDGDRLMAQAPRQPAAAAIFSERPDHFEFEAQDVDLDFERDAAGKVIAVNAGSGASKTRAVKMAN